MQILNAIREHYLMKREADHGMQPFYRFLPRVEFITNCTTAASAV